VNDLTVLLTASGVPGTARLVRALRDQLAATPGDQRLVLGETAAIARSSPRATAAAEPELEPPTM
jgi:hypothetical protein